MIDLPTESEPFFIVGGDCLPILRALPSASVDAVITDPPYPCIKREYGYWTEAEWFALMNPVVEECRRVLKPTGSAVFVLQPNSERVGRMRTWLLEFTLKWAREWGWIQDAYWWNVCAIPEAHSIQGRLMRPSVKACIWLGSPDCYRDQDAALWSESEECKRRRMTARCERLDSPSGHGANRARSCAAKRGGVSPFNVLPFSSVGEEEAKGTGHAAMTPGKLCRWWVRYICPPGGTVLDPFTGSGTVPLAALAEGRKAIGIERHLPYAEVARERAAERMETGLFAEVG